MDKRLNNGLDLDNLESYKTLPKIDNPFNNINNNYIENIPIEMPIYNNEIIININISKTYINNYIPIKFNINII